MCASWQFRSCQSCPHVPRMYISCMTQPLHGRHPQNVRPQLPKSLMRACNGQPHTDSTSIVCFLLQPFEVVEGVLSLCHHHGGRGGCTSPISAVEVGAPCWDVLPCLDAKLPFTPSCHQLHITRSPAAAVWDNELQDANDTIPSPSHLVAKRRKELEFVRTLFGTAHSIDEYVAAANAAARVALKASDETARRARANQVGRIAAGRVAPPAGRCACALSPAPCRRFAHAMPPHLGAHQSGMHAPCIQRRARQCTQALILCTCRMGTKTQLQLPSRISHRHSTHASCKCQSCFMAHRS